MLFEDNINLVQQKIIIIIFFDSQVLNNWLVKGIRDEDYQAVDLVGPVDPSKLSLLDKAPKKVVWNIIQKRTTQ